MNAIESTILNSNELAFTLADITDPDKSIYLNFDKTGIWAFSMWIDVTEGLIAIGRGVNFNGTINRVTIINKKENIKLSWTNKGKDGLYPSVIFQSKHLKLRKIGQAILGSEQKIHQSIAQATNNFSRLTYITTPLPYIIRYNGYVLPVFYAFHNKINGYNFRLGFNLPIKAAKEDPHMEMCRGNSSGMTSYHESHYAPYACSPLFTTNGMRLSLDAFNGPFGGVRHASHVAWALLYWYKCNGNIEHKQLTDDLTIYKPGINKLSIIYYIIDKTKKINNNNYIPFSPHRRES